MPVCGFIEFKFDRFNHKSATDIFMLRYKNIGFGILILSQGTVLATNGLNISWEPPPLPP